ncbi:MAG: LysM peptidoglycan-binding domain-containing protein [Verrucomicrobiaceae bacterium]
MMKPNLTLQTKRTKPKGSAFRILNAATGNRKKRKQRAATATADDLGEVPGVGVARALVVILLLHVVAIGGIWLHNKWSNENNLEATPAAAVTASPEVKPNLIPGGKHYFVERGDNYLNIARKHGVDVEALKKANNAAALSPGLKINVPPRRVESTMPSEAVIGHQTPAVIPVESTPAVRPVERPVIQPNDTDVIGNSTPGAMVQVESTPPARTSAPESQPLLIKPRIRHDKPIPKAIPVAEPLSGKVHTVVKGDSIWRLSKKYGVSQDSLLKANGISDPSKIRLGAKLNIPAQ